MANQSSPNSREAPAPAPPGAARPDSVGFAYYGTDHGLTCYLRSFERVRAGRLVVVLALQDRKPVSAAALSANVRIIVTALGADADPDDVVGWVVPDPVKAIVMAMTGLKPTDGLVLLFPADWRGDSPAVLAEAAKSRLAARTAGRGDCACE